MKKDIIFSKKMEEFNDAIEKYPVLHNNTIFTNLVHSILYQKNNDIKEMSISLGKKVEDNNNYIISLKSNTTVPTAKINTDDNGLQILIYDGINNYMTMFCINYIDIIMAREINDKYTEIFILMKNDLMYKIEIKFK